MSGISGEAQVIDLRPWCFWLAIPVVEVLGPRIT